MNPEDFATVESAFLAALSKHFAPEASDVFLSVLSPLYPGYAHGNILRTLLVQVHLGRPDPIATAQLNIGQQDRLFAEFIAAFKTGHRESTPVREIGPAFDFLADTCFLPNLTPIQVVNLLLLRTIQPTKSAAVVVTMRDEGPSMLEWIAFYQAIGIAGIFVYTNDNADGSEEVLELLASAGVITLIENSIAVGTNPQRKAYQHAVHLLRELREYSWVLFLDADEFLVVNDSYDYRLDPFIRHVEDTFAPELPGAVVFPWEWHLSDLAFKRADGLLFERYPHSVPDSIVKSLTRLNAALGMCEVHIPTLELGASIVDSALEPVEVNSVWDSSQKSRQGGAISHFWGKSFEEFAVKKRRGELLSFDDNPMLRECKNYFEWSVKPSPENYRPAPPVLLQRIKQALKELIAIPGVVAASERVQRRFQELSLRVQKESHLKRVYNEMRSSIESAAE